MSSKYQREIEDILEKAGDLGPRSAAPAPRSRSFPRLVWLYVRQSLSGRLWSISPGRVMLIGFALLLSTLLVRPFAAGATGYLAWGGLLLFIVGYGMVLAKPPKLEKRWRGQTLDPERASRLDSVRAWISRRLRRGG